MTQKTKPPKPTTANARLTKSETAALWHAVQCMEAMLKAMPTIEGLRVTAITEERERLATAKRALRKVNALRAAGA